MSYLNAGNVERSLQFTAFHETFHVAETRAKAGDVSAQQFIKTAESIVEMIDDKDSPNVVEAEIQIHESEMTSAAREIGHPPYRESRALVAAGAHDRAGPVQGLQRRIYTEAYQKALGRASESAGLRRRPPELKALQSHR